MKPRTRERPIGVDLFAGVGGLSLGFEQAGFDIAAAVEIDPIHCAAHEFNFPYSTVICKSVVELSGKELRARAKLEARDIDVVFGGAPCQGFSMIGKRALDDPRNQLVFHYVRLVRELAPKYCVFENVKGLTIGKHKAFLNEIIEALERGGEYRVVQPYAVLNSADFGVPQDRRRLFLIAARRDAELPTYPAPNPRRVTVADAIGDLPDADGFKQLEAIDSVTTKWRTNATYARQLRGLEADPTDYSRPRQFEPNLLTASLRTSHTELSRNRFLATMPGAVEPVSRFKKLDLTGLCNTLRAGTDSARGAFTSPRPIHPLYARVITVREAARLHSYPDWFRFHSTKWHGFRQIGNSVPPLLGRAVAREVMRALGHNPVKPVKIMQLGDQSLLRLQMAEAANHFRVPSNVIAQRIRKQLHDERQQELGLERNYG